MDHLIKTWSILNLNVLNELYGMTNVVYSITWKYEVKNAINPSYDPNIIPRTVQKIGQTQIELPVDANNFIQYENLTEAQTFNWLFTVLGEKKYLIENQTENEFLSLIMKDNPNIKLEMEKPVPWQAP